MTSLASQSMERAGLRFGGAARIIGAVLISSERHYQGSWKGALRGR